MDSFKAFVVEREGDIAKSGIREFRYEELPPGELLIRVSYSSVNYKDALACSPKGNVAKINPLVPGIDLAGVVVSTEDAAYAEGDEVIVTSYGLGVSHFGGYSEYARVPSEWAVMLPKGLTLKEAMIYGTAGFTAGMSVLALRENGIVPERGPVLVTGATGGVGSVSVAILAKLGYEVVASTGKMDAADELIGLGANRVIDREELVPQVSRSLDRQLWSGAVDCVGGKTLATVLSTLHYGGAVAASGLTGGTELATTVFPFILRGVRLIGIDSVFAPMAERRRVWELLASEYKPEALSTLSSEIGLDEVPSALSALLAGQSRGRVVVKIRE
ncbi:acryloyl-CoA reductase [Cohnella endophytica]|uniref:Acryloyl-CoA reductase n=1 Tax=Cohnella endophytica TaxID=2419778 RepID=A0A494XHG2_9BACL|nr:oxidoreductase [Cohnella endophytica]RKP50070.1 acryloyl-CoA reductase [Cohnella endophytica]